MNTEQNLDPHCRFEENNKPEVQEWLKSQAARAEDYFNQIPVRDELRTQFRKLFSLDTVGMPAPREGKYFSAKRRGDQEMAVLYVQEGISGVSRVLIDPNTLSEDKTTTLTGWYPSRDGRLLAYSLSKAGNDKDDVRVMDVVSGRDLPDHIPDDFYPGFQAWAIDGSGFWYTQHDPTIPISESTFEAKLHQRVYYHVLGTDYRNDPLVFGETLDKEDFPGASVSRDGRYLLIGVAGHDKQNGREWSEVYLRDLTTPQEGFVRIVERRPGTKGYGMMHRGTLYIVTNENAPRWHVMQIDIEDALQKKGAPQVCIPEGKGTLEEIALVADKLFAVYFEDVHSVIRQYDLRGNFVREFPLPTLGSAGGFSYEREGDELFYSFNSFAVPFSIYRIELAMGDSSLFARMEAGFDTDILATEQVWYSSKDGTRVPMFLIHKKGLERNSNNPTVLYGYGGFDISLTPSFMKSIVPFLERGGLFVIANLRGGGEFGKEWHEGGMQKNKQNVFDDFVAAVRWLIDTGYTCREKLAIEGGSNGGLLTMTTITQNPDLVAAAIASVPVTDMLRYHLFFGGVHWVPDYGHPDDPDMRAYLLGYSPYHNVRNGEKSPAVLIMTSDSDDRVHPMHAYKMAARLQEANASAKPIFLRVELKAGHGGASAISKLVNELADMWSFVFDQLGVVK